MSEGSGCLDCGVGITGRQAMIQRCAGCERKGLAKGTLCQSCKRSLGGGYPCTFCGKTAPDGWRWQGALFLTVMVGTLVGIGYGGWRMVGWNTAPTEAPTSLSAEVGAITPASARGQYVRITGEAVNVRTEPSTQSTVIVVVERGYVFGFVGRQGQWLEITMFSGDSRWVHGSLAQVTTGAPQMPSSEATRRRAFVEFVRAERRSIAEADRRYSPTQFTAQIDYQRLLYDRYALPVFRRNGIASTLRTRLIVEGIEKNWLPPRGD